MHRKKYLSLMLVAALGFSSLYGVYPALASQEVTSAFSQVDAVSPVSGHLSIQSKFGKSPIYDAEITEGQTIPLAGLLPNQEYNVSIDGDVLYFGSIVIDASGKANLDLYTLENDSDERGLFSAIEYEREPNNSMNKANVLRSNTVYGRIDKKNDKDFFKVTIPSSGDYAFVLDNIPTNKDYDLYLYNAKGKVISVSAGASSTEIIRSSNLFANEVYYLEVRGYKGDFDKSETYRLQYAQIKSFTDDHGNNREQATRIETDTDIPGKIDYPKDVDYFTFTAPHDGSYSIFSKGNTDTKAELYDANGKLLAENDNGENWNFLIEYTLSKGSQYYVAVSHTGIGTGSYTLFVQSPTTTPSKPNAGNSFDTATPIQVDDVKSGWFENPQDERYFAFTPTESGSYGFYTQGDLDTYGYLYASDKTTLLEENDNANEKNAFHIAKTLIAGQTYYIKVAINSFGYTPQADFSLSVIRYNALNDTEFAKQKYLLDTTKGVDINLLPALQFARGKGIRVGVADSGMDTNHTDIYGNVNTDLSYNFVHNMNDVFPYFEPTTANRSTAQSHGMHVAGTIAAQSDNNQGVAGIAPDAEIVSYKAFGAEVEGIDYMNSYDAFVASIEKAKQDGVRIINASFGGTTPMKTENEAIKNAPQILFVVAAGNKSYDLAKTKVYPACYGHGNILVVASCDENGELSDFSNYGGPTAVAAPGEKVYNTFVNDEYGYKSGTSMATPMVAGVSALVWSKNPNLTALEVKDIVSNAANTTQYASLKGYVSTSGVVNAFKAVSNDISRRPLSTENENAVEHDPFAIGRDVKEVVAEIKETAGDSEKTGGLFVKWLSESDKESTYAAIKEKTSIDFTVKDSALPHVVVINANTVAEADRLVDEFNALSTTEYAEPIYVRTLD